MSSTPHHLASRWTKLACVAAAALAACAGRAGASEAYTHNLQKWVVQLAQDRGVEAGRTAAARPATRGAKGAASKATAAKAATSGQKVSSRPKLGFNSDVRPILAENCFACHGPDPGSRKAGLRLDTKEGFFADRGDGPTIVAGKPLQSPLYQRIASKDPDEIMPPPDSHKSLKPAQIALIRRWIEEGAPWQGHWAFLKPERPALPKVKDVKWAQNPIDTFVLAKLEATGLKPAPFAGRAALARRAAFDLTGLPPDPKAVQAFLNDKSPKAYEKFVDGLLASPRWGEHRGRYWLDAARYADTHGLHFDNYREMWPYRDWVIAAFNKNQPFDKFTVEQIAGDLLPNPTQDQLVATGFHRSNITTNEGGTIEEENLALYANDRVSTTGWVFSGLTMNCAGCHDHKFDPITQKDFYAMAAFFRNTTQTGLDGNVKDGRGPAITVVTDPDDLSRWQELPGRIKVAKSQVEQRRKDASPDFEKWLGNLKSADFPVPTEKLALQVPLNEGAGQQVLGTAEGAAATFKTFKTGGPLEWKADGKIGPAPIIKAGSTFELGSAGDFEKDQAWSYGAWVKAPGSGQAGVLARMDEDNDFRGWDLWAQERNYATHIIHKWPVNALKVATTDGPMRPGQWQHVFVTYDGSAKPEGVKIFIDGTEAPLRVEGEANTLTGTIRTTTPLRIGQRSKISVFEGGQVQDVRIYGRKLEVAEVKSLAQNSALQVLASLPAEKRAPEQKQSLQEHFLANLDAPYQEASRAVALLEQEREGIRAKYPITHVQQERTDTMPMASILIRGDYSKPGEKVEANVPSALPPLPSGAPKNRLGLAQWLVHPNNPLTARVSVNRFWQEVFGIGLVKTADDFGIMGEAPSHPELLDWLSVEFREGGWDVKKLFKLIVTSNTYKQAAIATPIKREKDRENRLISRGPRFRMDAEVLRDYALAASGVLSPKMGGPGTKPYNPSGLWDVVGLGGGDTRNYVQDKGENLYRRSVYSFWKRMSPPANLDIFNAPSREVSCVRRERTNTPLQALVTLNDPQFVEAARLLAQNALKEAATSNSKAGDDQALDFIAWRLLSRALRPQERKVVKATLQEMATEYAAKPDEAKALLAVGESKADESLPAPKLAAWTLVTSQILNLDEALNK
jgi:mono/diheme cytochrome c family protein